MVTAGRCLEKHNQPQWVSPTAADCFMPLFLEILDYLEPKAYSSILMTGALSSRLRYRSVIFW